MLAEERQGRGDHLADGDISRQDQHVHAGWIERRDEGRKPAAEARDEASDMLRVDVDRVPVCVPDCPAAGLGSCTRACLPRSCRQISRGDQAASPSRIEEAFGAIGSTDKRIVWYEDSNHHLLWDYDREAVKAEILAFVAKGS